MGDVDPAYHMYAYELGAHSVDGLSWKRVCIRSPNTSYYTPRGYSGGRALLEPAVPPPRVHVHIPNCQSAGSL